jgi:acetyl esterase/lipase
MGAANRLDEITCMLELTERYAYPAVHPNITYHIANNFQNKLDLYVARGTGKARPTLMYFHSGGWMGELSKEMFPFDFLPFLHFGWNVANVEYRPSNVSHAPAAVEDCLCALRWVIRNAAQYNVDTRQIVLMGQSAGGTLALTTGMIPLSAAGLGRPGQLADTYDSATNLPRSAAIEIPPAAIIDWFGPTDIAEVAEGPNQQEYAVSWLGNQSDRMSVAKLVSPLSYVRVGLPPTVMIYGDQDPGIPYSQALRLRDALTQAGVSNKLITITGGGHGRFGLSETRDAYDQIFDFLENAGVKIRPD